MPDHLMQAQNAPKFEPLEILNASEPWTELFLSDGTKLRVRLIVTAVRKVVGVTNPDGSPVLAYDSQFVHHTIGVPK